MIYRPPACAFFFWILVALFSVRVFGLTVPPDGTLDKGTLNRFPDPVLIQGKAYPSMTGGVLGNYRVYACRDSRFVPIRFQIDEMTEEGDFIFPYGEKSNKDLSNGILDPRDVLLFMAKDTGDRVAETSWPEGASKGTEIEVMDPVAHTRSWAYLFYFQKNPPPLCPLPDYLHYDAKTATLGGEYWEAQYARDKKGRVRNFYNYFKILPKGGGNGENFIDRLKVRGTIKLFFGKITLEKNEENLDSWAIDAWIQGPIRIVRRLEHIVRGPFHMKLVRIVSDIQYYETMFTTPIHFNFPFKIERVVTSLSLRIGTDYAPVVKGSMFYNSNNPQGIRINGKMDETEAHFNPKADHWRVMVGKWGALMTRSVLTPEAEKRLQIVQGITDDETFIDPPETYPGSIGWTWQDWRIGQLPGGHYTFYLEFYVPPHYKPGDEVQYLNYLDKPLEIKIAGNVFENQVRLFGQPGEEY